MFQISWASTVAQWLLSGWKKLWLQGSIFMSRTLRTLLTVYKKIVGVDPRHWDRTICIWTYTRVLARGCPYWRESGASGSIFWHPHTVRARAHGKVLAYTVGARRAQSNWQIVLCAFFIQEGRQLSLKECCFTSPTHSDNYPLTNIIPGTARAGPQQLPTPSKHVVAHASIRFGRAVVNIQNLCLCFLMFWRCGDIQNLPKVQWIWSLIQSIFVYICETCAFDWTKKTCLWQIWQRSSCSGVPEDTVSWNTSTYQQCHVTVCLYHRKIDDCWFQWSIVLDRCIVHTK